MSSPTGFDDQYVERDQLRDQLRQLLRYPLAIATGIVLGLLGGLLLVQLRAGGYTSTADVLVRPKVDPISTYGVSVDNQVSMGTERQIGESATVADRAARALGQPSRAAALSADLRVTNPPGTQMLSFAYTAASPQRAAQVANAFARAYLADRQDRTRATVQRMTSGLEQQLEVLAGKKSTAKTDDLTAADRRDQINALQKRISDVRAFDTSGGDIVRVAQPPARPAGPSRRALIGIGLPAGLLLGLVLAWLRSVLEPRVRSVGEVQAVLDAPVLGILPARGTGSGRNELLQVGRVAGSRAEAYRTLAYRLRHGEDAPGGRTLLVVAPRRDGNAEAAAVNIAAALTESGDDVLLVDATAGTRGISSRLPLAPGDSGPGSEAAALPEGRVAVDAGSAGRFLLLPGTRGTDDVAASATVTRALSCADSGTTVIAVTRPLLEHTDGPAVAQRVDGVLVVGGDHTRRDDLKRLREQIGCSGGRIVGAVLDADVRRNWRHRPKKNRATTPASSVPEAAESPVPGQQADGTAAKEELAQP
ncbi:hypothetical protein [Streptomyces sp. NPDC003393]